jgi:6-pyruvoyltetrahydropterin/6-carboxytetrahydropterin synthase
MLHGPPGPITTTLRRRVRVNFGHPGHSIEGKGCNGYAGLPAMHGWGTHYDIEVTCAGPVDPRVGYLVDIKEIDRAVRSAVIPLIAESRARSIPSNPGELLPRLASALSDELLGRLQSLRIHLSPYYSVEVHMNTAASISPRVLIRQKLDFAASHRLHAPHLSPEENRRLFGKCNNPNGHGHNYQIEPCVAVSLGADGLQRFTLADLERITDAALIEPFDHKYLNEDTAEFATGTGVNPSVENIAMVFFNILAPHIEAAGNAELVSLTVWETDRTSSTYPG